MISFLKIIGAFFLGVGLFICYGLATADSPKVDPIAAAIIQERATPIYNPIPTWEYDQIKDRMSGKVSRLAGIESKNFLNFKFPYDGAQRATLNLWRPEKGKSYFNLIFEKAHFLCHQDNCAVKVRLDDDQAMTLKAYPPSDHSTNVIIFFPTPGFLRKLETAKIMSIEAEFYQDGRQIMDFQIKGYKPN